MSENDRVIGELVAGMRTLTASVENLTKSSSNHYKRQGEIKAELSSVKKDLENATIQINNLTEIIDISKKYGVKTLVVLLIIAATGGILGGKAIAFFKAL